MNPGRNLPVVIVGVLIMKFFSFSMFLGQHFYLIFQRRTKQYFACGTHSAIQCKTPQQVLQTNNNNKNFNTDFLFHGQAYNEIPFITAGGAGAREVCQTTRVASRWLDC
jgi:hypothetical protein